MNDEDSLIELECLIWGRFQGFYNNSYPMNKSYLAIVALLATAAVIYNLKPAEIQNGQTMKYLNFLRQFGKQVPVG